MKIPNRYLIIFLACANFPALLPSVVRGEEPRGFPDPMPADISFSTVVSSQDYPKLRYPVPIIGWKNHPEEIHVTPAGGLVFPEPRWPASLSMTPALRVGDDAAPALLNPDVVSQHLVDGYKPGVESQWQTGGLKIHQLAFGSLLEGEEVLTGRETLIGLCRYTIKNESSTNIAGQLYLCFGEGARHQSIKRFQRLYPGTLSFTSPFLVESSGVIAACVLRNSLGAISFKPADISQTKGTYSVLNQDERTVQGAEYIVEIKRKGDNITIGDWNPRAGFDLYFEASKKHSSPVGIELEVKSGGNSRIIGWLSRHGLSNEAPPENEFLAPGDLSEPISWADLSRSLPQGKSKLVLHAHVASAQGEVVSTWEPIVHLTFPGSGPVFKLRTLNPEQNSLQITFQLKPGQEKAVDIAVPYFPVTPAKAAQIDRLQLNDRLADFRHFWETELNRNAEFIVPEQSIRDSYRACLAYNLILVDRDPATGLLLPHPDATDYEHVWGGDSGVIIQSMDRLGYHREAEDYTKIFLVRQGTRKPDGAVKSAEGFFPGDARERWISENGFILWALAEHYKLTGDKDWLRAVAPKMVASANWIINEREGNKDLVNGEKPRHYGLLPQGRSSDLADWDYWYFNDSYSYLGLRDAAEVLPDAGFNSDAVRIKADAEDYKACILSSVERSINRRSDPPFVPLTPYKNDDPTRDYLYRYWYSICSPIYMVEAGIFGPQDEKATWIIKQMEKLVMVSGLPRFSPDEIDPHYVYNTALTELERGDTDKFIWTLYSLFAYGQSRDTYATIEVVNYRTGDWGDNWDACRQPHMHSNSRVLAMLRIALVLEQGKDLHLMMGAPRGWLDDGKRIEVRKAPTYFGDIEYSAESRVAAGKILIKIQPPTSRAANIILHVRPPTKFGQIRSVTVNGKPWNAFAAETVSLGQLAGKVTVECNFK